MKGAIGKPGAGTCPVRGHSNVQGDRTMGIWEKMPKSFLDSLQKEFGFTPPTEHGLDVVEAIKAMRLGKTKVYFSLGGNLLAAGPDTEVIAEGMRNQNLTVFVGTKLNRGHLITGETSLLLPTFAHVDIDMQKSGHQMTSCENSMGVVSQNKGILVPAGRRAAERSGHHLRHGHCHAGRQNQHRLGGHDRELRRHPRPHCPRHSRLRGLQREAAPARRLLPAQRPPRAQVHHRKRQGQLQHHHAGEATHVEPDQLVLMTVR